MPVCIKLFFEQPPDNQQFRYDQIWYPAQPRHKAVCKNKIDTKNCDHGWKVDPKRNSGKAQGVTADHPMLMRSDFMVADGNISPQCGIQP